MSRPRPVTCPAELNGDYPRTPGRRHAGDQKRQVVLLARHQPLLVPDLRPRRPHEPLSAERWGLKRRPISRPAERPVVDPTETLAAGRARLLR